MLVTIELNLNWEEKTTERLQNKYIACNPLLDVELEVHVATHIPVSKDDSESNMPYYWEVLAVDGQHRAGFSRSEELAKQHAVEYLLVLLKVEEKQC